MKNTIAALAGACIFALIAPANAGDWNPYAGVGFQGSVNSYKQYNNVAPSLLWGGEAHVGITPHKNFGAEFSYSGQFGKKGAVSVSMHTVGIDGLAYAMPLKNSKHFKIIGTAGLVGTAYSGKSPAVNLSGAEFGLRGGGGLQFGMTENTNVRTLVRYQHHFGSTVGGGLLYSVGVNYEF